LSSISQHVEDAVGLFDLALSFAGDAEAVAETMAQIAAFHGLACYHYRHHLISQSGLDIMEVMRFVYRLTERVVVLNSKAYGGSVSTRLEIETLSNAPPGKQLFLVDMGGVELHFPMHNVVRHSGLGSEVAMSIVEAASPLRPGRVLP
jgi:hypothetical protein